ncbi:pilus assembly protein TadG-related protein [Arthrobacter sp. KK5.5]|uniref:pilus assembly protein TadG-related protein n=1 Tax=Arthrobacter sp. KK5.5 TaxID=3373084 RepID=UPI003EE637BD
MRGITHAGSGSEPGTETQRGAASVILAVMMVALLGFTALVVDVGFLYAERTELQNGADAAAVGTAQKCARSTADADCSPSSPLAASLADANARDGLHNVDSIDLNLTTRKVTVTTGAEESGGAENTVSLFFANALGVPSAEVGARSSAIWGSPRSGRTAFPAAFSVCQVQGRVDGGLQRLGLHGGAYANGTCNLGPSGQAVAGGFGWLAQDPGQCGGFIDLAASEGGSGTGNNEPPNCAALFTKWIGDINAGRSPVVLLPVFNKVVGTGSNAVYGLTSFAAFSVAGWKFTGGNEGPGVTGVFHNTSTWVGDKACTGDCRAIIGKFITYVSLEEGYTLGPVDANGARVVQMTD